MNAIDTEIRNLLEQGFSYREIASRLEVSTRRIAEVKKTCFHQETASDKGFGTTENRSLSTKENISFEILPYINQFNIKNSHMENNENILRNHENENPRYVDVEIRKLELTHDLEIKKLSLLEREIKIKEDNVLIEKEKLAHERNKNEEAIRLLQFRLDELMDRCIEGEWEQEAALDFFDEVDELAKEVAKFAYINNVTEVRNFDTHTLQLIHAAFDEFTLDWDEDELSRTIEFEQDLRDALE